MKYCVELVGHQITSYVHCPIWMFQDWNYFALNCIGMEGNLLVYFVCSRLYLLFYSYLEYYGLLKVALTRNQWKELLSILYLYSHFYFETGYKVQLDIVMLTCNWNHWLNAESFPSHLQSQLKVGEAQHTKQSYWDGCRPLTYSSYEQLR